MALTTVQAELVKSLGAYLTSVTAAGYQIGLFKSNTTITVATVLADLTPADFGGYSGLQTIGAWAAVSFSSPRATSSAPSHTWTCDGTSSNTIYGYYVVDPVTGLLAWAERAAAAPITIGSAGQIYVVTPAYTRRSEF